MYCSSCGKSIGVGDRYCSGCGNLAVSENRTPPDDMDSGSIITPANKKFFYLFIFPAIFISNFLPLNELAEADSADYIVSGLVAFAELALVSFIVFNRLGKNKSTTWLTIYICVYAVLFIIGPVAVTLFGSDFPQYDQVRLSSGLDYACLFINVAILAFLAFLRKKFNKTK